MSFIDIRQAEAMLQVQLRTIQETYSRQLGYIVEINYTIRDYRSTGSPHIGNVSLDTQTDNLPANVTVRRSRRIRGGRPPQPRRNNRDVVIIPEDEDQDLPEHRACSRVISRRYSEKQLDEVASEICSICMETPTLRNTYKTSCGHYYCMACFDSWEISENNQNKNIRCAMCRVERPIAIRYLPKERRAAMEMNTMEVTST